MFNNLSRILLCTSLLVTSFAHSELCCNRFWADAEYLYWKIKDSPAPPPLIVTGPTAVPLPVLNGPGTSVVLGGKRIDNHWRSGGRFTLGYTFDTCCQYSVEANYLFLPTGHRKDSIASNGLPGSAILATPFFDVTTGTESSASVSVPGVFHGSAIWRLKNSMQGAELNFVSKHSCGCATKYGFLAGFRYWNFDERFHFRTSSPNLGDPDVFTTTDKFHTENNFYGGQIGAGIEYNCNCFFAAAKAKVALGAMCERVNISGSTVTNDFNGFGPLQTFPGGYFALPTNIGHHHHTQFAVIPEAEIKLGYNITNCFRVSVGYTFLYVSRVLRATKQIDRNINPSQSNAIAFVPDVALVGEPRPKAQSRASDFWVQGATVGLEFTF